ncbi:MAG: cell wall hydrolase, partial [Caulobacteraceae bacterium]|nr:cell wall hydrolase [Caulobacter sp.]
MNAAQPLDPALLNAARPFVLTGAAADRARALTCLTQAVYYEAASEPVEGQRAVAQVVLNRVRHPLFPHSVCGVVYQGASLATGCQFSFVCDGSMQRGHDAAGWALAQDVARAALAGSVQPEVGEATHYHATYVAPYWAPTVAKVAHIGLHIFYRWTGAMGLPSAFTARYAAVERIPVVRPHVVEAAPLQLASAPEAEAAGARLESYTI